MMKLGSRVLQFLKACRKKGVVLALVTNFTAELQYKKLRRLGIEKYFNFIVTSEETGLDKPYLLMFSTYLEKSGLQAKEMLIQDKTLVLTQKNLMIL